jgi:Flp pilus assembly protein TadD
MEELLYSIQHSTKEELTYSRTDYLLTQFRVVASYLRLMILPINLNLDYDIPLQKSLFTLPVLASLLLHVTLLATSVALYIRSGRLMLEKPCPTGICLRLISFGIVWFYLTLTVESSIIPILDVMFEHRLYLPSGGVLLVMTAAAAALAAARRSLRTAAWVALAIICCILTVATIQRNRIWNNDLLLWEDTARKSPNKPRVLANLTAAYLREGQPGKALPVLIRTIELSPGFTDALNNLGTALDSLKKYGGRYDNGRRFIVGTRTVDMRYYNTWFANTRNNLGLVYEYTGNLEKARHYYEAAVTLVPSFDLAWYNLLLMGVRQQDRELAADAYSKLMLINPALARSVVMPPGDKKIQ